MIDSTGSWLLISIQSPFNHIFSFDTDDVIWSRHKCVPWLIILTRATLTSFQHAFVVQNTCLPVAVSVVDQLDFVCLSIFQLMFHRRPSKVWGNITAVHVHCTPNCSCPSWCEMVAKENIVDIYYWKRSYIYWCNHSLHEHGQYQLSWPVKQSGRSYKGQILTRRY